MTDVVGYTADGHKWCADCLRSCYGYDALEEGKLDYSGDSIRAIQAGSKWDYPLHCTRCREKIDVVVRNR